jgi:hypothetical protein
LDLAGMELARREVDISGMSRHTFGLSTKRKTSRRTPRLRCALAALMRRIQREVMRRTTACRIDACPIVNRHEVYVSAPDVFKQLLPW